MSVSALITDTPAPAAGGGSATAAPSRNNCNHSPSAINSSLHLNSFGGAHGCLGARLKSMHARPEQGNSDQPARS